jgi:hypothetical protein
LETNDNSEDEIAALVTVMPPRHQNPLETNDNSESEIAPPGGVNEN